MALNFGSIFKKIQEGKALDGVYNFVGGAAGSLANLGANVAQAPVNALRYGVAEATGNKGAQQSAARQLQANVNQVKPVVRPLVQAGNTAMGLSEQIAALSDVGAQSIFGNDQSYLDATQRKNQVFNRTQAPGYGIMGEGTFFEGANDPVLTGKANVAQFGGRFTAKGAQLAPYFIGNPSGSVLKQGVGNAVVGGVGSVGQQYADTGQVDLGQVGADAATGVVQGAISQGVSKAIAKARGIAGSEILPGGKASASEVPKPINENVNRDVMSGKYTTGKSKVDLKQQATDLAASQARAKNPAVQAFKKTMGEVESKRPALSTARVDGKYNSAPVTYENSKSLKLGSDTRGPYDKKRVLQQMERIEKGKGKGIDPIVVKYEKNVPYVTDGKNTLEAYQKLGYKEIPVVEQGAILPKVSKSMYTKGALGDDVPADWIKPKTEGTKALKSMVDEAADALDSYKKDTGGVSLIPGEGDAKIRSSANPKWYKEFYAANKRAPNKSELRNFAYTLLEKKDPEISNLVDTDLYHATKEMAKEAPAKPKVTLKETPKPVTQNIPKTTNNAEPLNVKKYVKEQTKVQEAAAKKDLSLPGRLREEVSTKGIDALAPIERPVEKAVGGRKNNLTLRNQLDRSLRSDTIAGQYAKSSGLHDVINGVKNTKEFDQYLLAKHGADLEANGIKTGRDGIKDKQLTQALSGKYEKQAQALNKYNQGLLDKTVDYGLISKETANMLKKKYPNYVPFDRIFKDSELQGKGNGSGPASLSTQTVIQRIKGSDRAVQSPLESVLAKTHDVVAQGERNLAAKEIANTIDLPGNPLGLKEIKGEPVGNRSTISYLENGKKRVFETTPEVAQAAKSLNKQQLGLVGKILAAPTRVLRLGATGLNPAFALANVAKDSVGSFVNSSHPLRSSVANPKVFLQALQAAGNHKSKAYAELVSEGAGGTSFDIARNSAKDSVKKIRAERNVGTKIAYTVTHPGELLRAVEDTIGRSEEYGRAMQYFGNKEAALKAGKGAKEARAYGADAARTNTVNFARAGEYGRVLNSVLPYMNAGVQGSRTLMRNLRDRPAQTAAKMAITAFLPMAATTAWNLKDPKRKEAYDDIKEYEKEGNLIIIPENPTKDEKTGRWNVIKIPIPQGISNLSSIVRNGVETMHGDKDFDFASMASDLFGTGTSINTGSPRELANQVIPQGAKPLVETITNQNLFTGNPIVSEKQKMLDPQDQIGKNTSGTARAIGSVTGQSPLMIDNAIRTSTGGAGQNALNFSDSALAKAGIINQDQVRGTTIEKAVMDRFTSAAGEPEYSGIDKAIEANSKKLKASEAYKKLSPEDKAAALNRLKNDSLVSSKAMIDYKNGTKTDTKLSDRQKGLLDGTTDIESYLTTQEKKGSAKNPKERYERAMEEYQKDKAEGKIGTIKDISERKSLNRLQAQSNFSQDVVDLYSLPFKEMVAYVDSTGGGADLWEQVKKLDKALVDKGGTSKLYDKKGNLKKTVAGSSGGSKGRKAGSVDTRKFGASLRLGGSIKVAKAKAAPKVASKTFRRVATSKPKVSIKKSLV